LTAWILLIFYSSKKRVNLTDVVSSLFSPRCRISSSQRRHTVAPYHVSFTFSQDELTASVSSFGNALSRHLLSRVKTKTLNLHHHCSLPSPNYLTLTLYYYKKIISILDTLLTTQTYINFISLLARASRHQSFNHRHRSLSPWSHVIISPYNDTHDNKLVDLISLPE
jgi:hypothetical protein